MKKIQCAVVGAGYFGCYHIEKYSQLHQCQLKGVVDVNQETRKKIEQKYQIATYSSHLDLIGKVEAVSITSPTPFHYKIAKDLLKNGIHLLIEKPITRSVKEADELIAIAKENNLILQVGHIERFNPIITLLEKEISAPILIEVDRLAQYSVRNKDTDVILDLMVHDLDLILNFVQDEIKEIQAKGIGIWTDVDIVSARITFKNGCTVNITESKFSQKVERKFRIFTAKDYFSINLKDYEAVRYFLQDVKNNRIDPIIYPKQSTDPLKIEITNFLHSIQTKQAPIINGEQGRRVLALALEIKNIIKNDKNYLS